MHEWFDGKGNQKLKRRVNESMNDWKKESKPSSQESCEEGEEMDECTCNRGWEIRRHCLHTTLLSAVQYLFTEIQDEHRIGIIPSILSLDFRRKKENPGTGGKIPKLEIPSISIAFIDIASITALFLLRVSSLPLLWMIRPRR